MGRGNLPSSPVKALWQRMARGPPSRTPQQAVAQQVSSPLSSGVGAVGTEHSSVADQIGPVPPIGVGRRGGEARDSIGVESALAASAQQRRVRPTAHTHRCAGEI